MLAAEEHRGGPNRPCPPVGKTIETALPVRSPQASEGTPLQPGSYKEAGGSTGPACGPRSDRPRLQPGSDNEQASELSQACDLRESSIVGPVWENRLISSVGRRRMRVGRDTPYAASASPARIACGTSGQRQELCFLLGLHCGWRAVVCRGGRRALPDADGAVSGPEPTPHMLRGPVPLGNRAALALAALPLSSRPLRAG